ncbi:MAG: putative lipid II flippase FtsW [Chloroflexi bacterium]|nr:putative lipid II flippase FtsW [Chloroflexota bacterium]
MQITGILPKPKIRVQQAEQGKPDYWLIAVVAILLILGTIMVYSASFVTAARTDDNPAYYLWRHLLWVGLGLAGCFVLARVDYHHWRRFSIMLMMIVLVLLLAVLVLPSQFAPSIAGARRWLTLSSDSNWLLQPSEIGKVVLILYGAHWLSSKGDNVRNFYYGLVPFALTVGFLVALIMGEPDLGTSLIIGAIGMTMFFVAGANMLHLLVGVGAAGGGFYILAFAAAYRLDRWAAYTDPFSDPTGMGYHTTQALLGLGSGGVLGVGLGVSRQKFMWLPTVFTDSIFAVIGEELGLVGTSLVVLLFLAFAWRGFQIALHAPDGFGRLIASGVTIYVVSQAFLNMAVVTNLVPFTGIPLPFISYGGSSLSVTLIALGMLLNVSRQQVAQPHLVEIEERRGAERRQRELLREQRQAQREQRQSTLKLREAEYAERQATELAHAQKRWYERTRAEREAERQFEEAERQREEEERAAARQREEEERAAARQREEEERAAARQREERERIRREIERGAEALRRKQAGLAKGMGSIDRATPHRVRGSTGGAASHEVRGSTDGATSDQVSDFATRSFLESDSPADRDTDNQKEEHLRPNSHRPRRDWAKVYLNAAQRKRDSKSDD